MRLVDMESKLNRLIEKDVNNDEIYKLILDLTYFYLLRYKKMYNKSESYEIASEIAADLYMQVRNGKSITYWVGYISKVSRSYIRNYLAINSKTIVDVSDVHAKESMINLSAGSISLSKPDIGEYSEIDFISNIKSLIWEVVNESRYSEYSKEYLNLIISIVLYSLGENIVFNLPDSLSGYVKYLYNQFHRKIIDSVSNDIYSNCIFNDINKVADLFMPFMEGGVIVDD